MSITLGKLLSGVQEDTTSATAFLFDEATKVTLAANTDKIVVIELFDATQQETIRIAGSSNPVQRGASGSEALDWNPGACACVLEIVACETPTGGGDGELPQTTTQTIIIEAIEGLLGKGLVVENGKLRLATSTVAPNTYAGLTVDECGRVTDVSDKFPANVPRDPCCAAPDGVGDVETRLAAVEECLRQILSPGPEN